MKLMHCESNRSKEVVARKKKQQTHENPTLNNSSTFPFKLHNLLDSVTDTTSNSITWNEDGSAFCILRRRAFTEHVMPQFFGPIKYKSFIRQLSMYGFEREKNKDSSHKTNWYYYHPLFVKGSPELCHLMVRQCIRRNYGPMGNDKTKDHQGPVPFSTIRSMDTGASNNKERQDANNQTNGTVLQEHTGDQELLLSKPSVATAFMGPDELVWPWPFPLERQSSSSRTGESQPFGRMPSALCVTGTSDSSDPWVFDRLYMVVYGESC